MSINVFVEGNRTCGKRKGRVTLSDLELIKRSEKERRRRLRLEQVRQQSKEISTRLLERAREVEREELRDREAELKELKQRKIMEIQNKYREDLEEIGQAHEAAALERCQHRVSEEAKLEEERRIARERAKIASEKIRDAKPIDERKELIERRKKVREVEDLRSTMIARIAETTKSTGTSAPTPSPVTQEAIESSDDEPEIIVESNSNNLHVNKLQQPSSKRPEPAKTVEPHKSILVKSPGKDKLKTPLSPSKRQVIVEKINVACEKNAVELAREAREAEEKQKERLEKCEKENRRSSDALLRERVRRDYAALLQNLEGLAREERRLRAIGAHVLSPHKLAVLDKNVERQSQRRCEDLDKSAEKERHSHRQMAHAKHTERRPENIERTKVISKRTIVKKKASSSQKLADLERNMSRLEKSMSDNRRALQRESIVTIPRRVEEEKKEPDAEWTEPCKAGKVSQDEVLAMLRKVERQKALLVEEFGAELPADILQSLRPASTDNNCPPTASTNASEEAREIRVVNVNVTPTEMEKAVQTSLTEPSPIDKSVQVEMSSNSCDSVYTGVLVDINRKLIKVTPKKVTVKRKKRKSKEKVVKKKSPGKKKKRANDENSPRVNSISDASTTYYSPPVIQRGGLLVQRSSITSILEMLGNGVNLQGEHTDVSTPDTPRSDVINISTNVPNIENVKRIIKFSESTSTSSIESRVCHCESTVCRNLHEFKGNAEVVNMTSKYEEIKNSCFERIASLNERINRIRNDQNVSEINLSGVAPSDETSLMLLPSSRRATKTSVLRDLVNNMNTIESQLQNALKQPEGGAQSSADHVDNPNNARRKPRIVSNEPVNFNWEVKQLSDEILEQSKKLELSNERKKKNQVNGLPTIEETESCEERQFPRRTSSDGLSGITEIGSTMHSSYLANCESPATGEIFETELKKHGLNWLLATLKKTREASALSSSSNSDINCHETAKSLHFNCRTSTPLVNSSTTNSSNDS